jgi:hypothetical protein
MQGPFSLDQKSDNYHQSCEAMLLELVTVLAVEVGHRIDHQATLWRGQDLKYHFKMILMSSESDRVAADESAT